MLIKSSRITNLTDARYFAAREAQFLGFNLEAGTEGYLDPIYMKAIREWVEGPVIVGEYSTSPASVVAEAAAFFALDGVEVGEIQLPELHLLKDLRVLLRLEQVHDPKAVRRLLEQHTGQFEFAVLHLSGSEVLEQEPEEWKSVFSAFPVLLHVDFNPEQLLKIMEAFQPTGLSLSGGAEEKVGVKSFDDIEAIFDALEQ
jgi:phosphoribosylanthranilate isomerase